MNVQASNGECGQLEVNLSENFISKLQVKLHFTEKALRLIAKKAMGKNTGARGLRALLEIILTEAMFEVMSYILKYIALFNYLRLVSWIFN